MALCSPCAFFSRFPTRLAGITTGSLQRTQPYTAPASNSIPPGKQKYVPKDGTYPQGFLCGTTHVGIKPSNTSNDDLAIIASAVPCNAAAVFTRNRFQAAPVVVSREVLKERGNQGIRAVVASSGCANAVTGKKGLEDARSMGQAVDRCFEGTKTDGDQRSATIVMSTGVIGQRWAHSQIPELHSTELSSLVPYSLFFRLTNDPSCRLPIAKITNAIPAAHSALDSTHTAWLSAARAICTTDTFPKLLSREFTLPSSSNPEKTYRIAGMTKGAGMIHPNMATLLGIICTDAPVAADALKASLQKAIARSFNSISIDGDTSTNDTVALLANGAAGGSPISLRPQDEGILSEFQSVLTKFSQDLSHLVVRDGEGATKFVTITVQGATTKETGELIASTIARSPLVKTALYGKDANWGRILCAVGYSNADEGAIIPEQTSVSFVPADGSEKLELLVSGEPQEVDEARAKEILDMEDLEILVKLRDDVSEGEEIQYWTCDFSHEYVTINGDYRT
jgi:glutamate N-acetyltransferase / amino-acid N-acetyltransferase